MMRPRGDRRASPWASRRGFTLIELLVSMGVLTLIVLLITGLADGTARVWSSGERSVENNGSGRALLEIIARELSQAVVSSKLPFVQDPVLPSGANQRPSNSIFWVAPLTSTSNGDLCEVGYYLTTSFELKRFFVPPSDTANYNVLTSTPIDYTLRPTGPTGGTNDHSKAALWATDFVTNNDGNNQPVSNTVAGGVLNFFVRCLDANGDPIPWLASSVKYNSAEPMRPATPGVRNVVGGVNGSNPSSFTYTYYDASNPTGAQNTAPANLLPYAIELTLVTTDLKTLQRLGTNAVPATPPNNATQQAGYKPYVLPAAPLATPGLIALFLQNAQAAGFREVRSFSTTVRLRNAAQ